MSETQFTRNAHGGTFVVGVSTPFTVELAENPTTGVRWHIEPSGLVLAASYIGGEAAGAGGRRRFTLLSTRCGVVPIRAALTRTWERHRAPMERCEFTVRVI